MKIIKRLTAILLCAVMSISLIPFSCVFAEEEGIIAEGSCGDSAYWSIDNDGTLTVFGTGEMYEADLLGSMPISDIKKLVVGEGITKISGYSFIGGKDLEEVILPSSLEILGSNAFEGCSSLASVQFSDGLKSIGGYCFYGCESLKTAYIPDTVIEIGYGAFANCYSLTEVTLPLDLKVIEAGVFSDCWLLDGIYIPEGVTVIEDHAFAHCYELSYANIPDTVTYIGREAFVDNALWSITIPGSVKEIGYGAFSYSDYLHFVFIEEGVEVISDYAFDSSMGGWGLSTVIIPESVTEIGDENYFGCSSSRGMIKCAEGSYAEQYAIDNGLYYEYTDGYINRGVCGDNVTWTLDCEGTLNISGNGDVYDYSNGNDISKHVPWNTYGSVIKNIIIEEGVSGLGSYALFRCNVFETITVPKSLTRGFLGSEAIGHTIYCCKDSYAESYAIGNNIPYELIDPYLTTEGVVLTVRNLYGAKDIIIARGECGSYREAKNNLVAMVTNAKFGKKGEYAYNLSDYGTYTVYIRYTDDTKAPVILKTQLSGPVPELSANGLQLTLKNLDGVKVIRTAYGDFNKAGDIKRAEGSRSVSGTDADSEYTFQYRENGLVSIAVVYENGYTHIFKHEVTKYTPDFVQEGSLVTISKLDHLKVIRYAKGEYDSSGDIKRAEGCVTITPKKIKEDTVSIMLDPGSYTFCVQYEDESYNYYTVTVR